MAEYTLVHEIQNLCPNNQLWDVFFEDAECDDPITCVRSRLKDRQVDTCARNDSCIDILSATLLDALQNEKTA